VPSWLPMMVSLFLPICFTINGILFKHLTNRRLNFNASTLQFTSYFVVNSLILVAAIIFWTTSKNFSPLLFWIGFGGSMLNTLGIVCAQNAMAKGPMGPSIAISNTNFILFALGQVVIFNNSLSPMEIIGMLVQFLGSMVTVIPHWFESIFCCNRPKGGQTPNFRIRKTN
jgi:drug/metabolite transporter (DMT)-like permease